MDLRRILPAAAATLLAFSLLATPVYAQRPKATPSPRPVPPGQLKKTAAPPILAPEIYQVNPTKVNPTTQPNIMILGQHLTPSTKVDVGGRPATTVQATDPNHLLVKLPDNLSNGSYLVEVQNDAGTAVSSDPLVVDGGGSQLSTLQLIAGVGFLLFLVLVMRLARTPGIA
jgi:IPT/TIG domain